MCHFWEGYVGVLTGNRGDLTPNPPNHHNAANSVFVRACTRVHISVCTNLLFRCSPCLDATAAERKTKRNCKVRLKAFATKPPGVHTPEMFFFFFFLNPDFSNSGTSPPPDFSKFRTLKCVSEKGLGSAGDHVTWREETRLFFFSFTLCMGLPCSSNNESLILLASGYNQFGELRASLFSSRRGLFFFLVNPPFFFFSFEGLILEKPITRKLIEAESGSAGSHNKEQTEFKGPVLWLFLDCRTTAEQLRTSVKNFKLHV